MPVRNLLAGLAAAIAVPASAQETYVVDPVHSQPRYETRHVGFATQHGNFGKMTGRIVLDRAARKGSVDFAIDATSVRSNEPRLDAVLKGERYFDVEKYPTLTFRSSNLIFDGDRLAGVDGDLTTGGPSLTRRARRISLRLPRQVRGCRTRCARRPP